MMTCRECVELLIDFLSGELCPEDLARFQHHLDCCPPCVAYIETYQLTIKLSRQLPSCPMPPYTMQRLHAWLQVACRQQPPPGGSTYA